MHILRLKSRLDRGNASKIMTNSDEQDQTATIITV